MSLASDVIPLWINGEQRAASTGETFEVRNPQSRRVVTVAASASSDDCQVAVRAAGEAFKTWEHTPISAKRTIFLEAANLLTTDRYRRKIFSAVAEETAAVSAWGGVNLTASITLLREAAQLGGQLKGDSWSSGYPGATAIMQRRALGVIFAIAPWNSPVNLTLRSICVPLICGNTAVVKSSEYSPRSQAIVAEVMHEAGLPPGVLNFISVSRENSPKLTAEVIGNPLVRKFNFTGSDNIGRILAAEAAKYLKPCVLELGGKAPAVVLNDADVDDASRAIIFAGMMHSGQVCMSTERVIVQRKIAPALISALTRLAAKLKAGDQTTDPSVQLGCLFTEGSAQNVCSVLTEAKQQGAEFLLGDGTRDGAIVQPHVLKGVKPGMRVWDRESFAPLVVIMEVDTVDEAVAMANTSDYSLMASLWTNDLYTGINVAGRLRAGSVLVNGATIHIEPQFGNGGLGGATGYGRFDIEDWTNKRMIVFHPPKQSYPLADVLSVTKFDNSVNIAELSRAAT